MSWDDVYKGLAILRGLAIPAVVGLLLVGLAKAVSGAFRNAMKVVLGVRCQPVGGGAPHEEKRCVVSVTLKKAPPARVKLEEIKVSAIRTKAVKAPAGRPDGAEQAFAAFAKEIERQWQYCLMAGEAEETVLSAGDVVRLEATADVIMGEPFVLCVTVKAKRRIMGLSVSDLHWTSSIAIAPP